MRSGLLPCRRLGLALWAPFLFAVFISVPTSLSTAVAAELNLQPSLESGEDLERVIPRPDGSAAVLRHGAIDLVRPGAAPLPLARAADDQSLYPGDDGAWIGVATYRGGAADFAPAATFELRDPSGAVAWIAHETPDITFAVSSTGAVAGMRLNINDPRKNALHFYNSTGRPAAEVALPLLTGGAFVPGGAIFIAVSATEGLFAYDTEGDMRWSVPGGRMFDATPDGGVVAVVGENWLRLVRDGTLSPLVDTFDFAARRVTISPDGNRVAIAGKHEIRVYDTAAPAMRFRTTLEDPALSWTSVDLAPDDGWMLAGVARDLGNGVANELRHPDGEVRAYDASGALSHRATLSFPIWNIWTPSVFLDGSGDAATVTTRRAVYRAVLP